jgi:hypothetical protein
MAFTTEALTRITTRTALQGGFRSATLTGAETLTKLSAQVQKLDPGGAARNVTLPTVSVDDDGYFFLVANAADAAENLVVLDAAAATIVTINQSEASIVYVDSAGAWQTVGVFTFAAS